MYQTSYPNVFDLSTVEAMKNRIHQLTPNTLPQWGKMNAGQMLAHLNVAYDLAYGKVEMKSNFIMRFFLLTFLLPVVVGDKPFVKNSRTAPVFVVEDDRDF